MADPFLTRLARNTGWLLGGKAANAVLSLAVLAVAARALGPEGLGRLVLLQSLVQFTAEIAKFQSWQGVVRYGAAALESGRPSDLARLVSFSALLDGASAGLGLAFLTAAGPWTASRLGWPPEVVSLVPLYGTAVVFLVPGTATGLLRLFNRFDLLATQSATANLIRLGGALAAWAAGGGFEAFALVWWIAAAGAGLMPVVPAWRLLAARGGAGLAWPRGIRGAHPGVWRFFLLTSLNSIIALAPTHLAILIVGTLLGPAAAGLFRVARQIADAAAKPAEFLAQALYPEAAVLSARGEMARLRRMLLRVGLTACGLAALALAVLAGVGERLLVLVAGPDFAAAAPVLAVLAVAAALTMAAVPLEPVLIALGRAGTVVSVKAAAAVLHVALLVALAQIMGLVGAGIAAAVAALAGLVLTGWYGLRILSYHPERGGGSEPG